MAKSFFKKGEMTKMSDAMLHNKFVLYLIFIIAVGNLFHFVFKQDLTSVGIFIAAGLLTSFFSKNMVVIMVVAMVVANVIRLGQGAEGFTSLEEAFEDAINEAADEAFQDDDDDDDETDDDDDDTDDEEDIMDDMDGFRGSNKKHKHDEGMKYHKHSGNEEKTHTKSHRHMNNKGHTDYKSHS